jgi:hypothetical protein
MIIKVHFDGKQLTANPDPAHVRVGDPVNWEVSGVNLPGSITSLAWEIYFNHGSPFKSQKGSFLNVSATGVAGAVPGDVAVDPGDWKYGIRVSNANTKALLEDEDPRLIVEP